ncbi:electron transport complex subunit RnfG [Betaproteobacteria bacterium]|nr:electron transport complex subunit RnfG [Betaproteobacteria bacterium]GHT96361.1 electron transport complex subunit RnfG [Betaproteobacteria bacterium]GHU16425.1 electron transport complex subunit RnfG [Betaproteobacteria bacterium]GHU16595.1 electron transport complex subunit RnfG [Betaproteobacteria bacterium]GHU23437.1 electron transport complex subunit RnfG [Betaproteobacteria bacterium]
MDFEKVKAHPLYQPLLLGVTALLASVSLAWASSATKSAIEAAEARDLRDSLAQVLPAGFADNDLLADTGEINVGAEKPLRVYRARKGQEIKGVVFKVIGKGYGGEIVILMAVDTAGSVLGVRILKHTETPGLGDKIDIAKDDWVQRFNGKALDASNRARWAVKKDGGDFDQFAGATITPRAVVQAVKGGLETFAAHKAALSGETP